MIRRRLWLLVMLGVACGTPKAQITTPGGSEAAVSEDARDVPSDEIWLQFKLREVRGTPASEARMRTLEGTPLSAKEAAQLWKSVPQLPAEPSDVLPFQKRPGSAPPPTASVVEQKPFPPPESAAGEAPQKPAQEPLAVLRYAPEGDIDVVRELSVTFNQPMVPLTSHERSVAGELPVKLSPMPPGKFRWVGTSTLLFTAEPRFAAATEYTVTIPKGVRSLSGQTLAKETSFRFRTPAIDIVDMWPSDEEQTSALSPVIYLAFNQEVDADKLRTTLKLEAGKERFDLRTATEEEIADDEQVKLRLDALAGEGLKDRALVLKPVKPLPPATRVTLTLPAGSSAGEGPLGTPKAIVKSFTTHGPLKFAGVTCSDGEACVPGAAIQLRFSNAIDPKRLDKRWFRFEPAVPFEVFPGGHSLYVMAETEPQTEYRVFVSGAVRDVFGQTLGKEQHGTFKVGDAHPEFVTPAPLVMLDPRSPGRTLNVTSVNVDELVVEVRKVAPKDYLTFAKAREALGRRGGAKDLPGQLVHSETISLKKRRNERVTSAIDLSKALTNGLGHAVVFVQPKPERTDRHVHQPGLTWVESTKLGIEAFWDRDELVVWTTSLDDGSAQGDVEVTLDPDALTAKSGRDGVARLALPEKNADRVRVLVAKKGADVALLPEYPWGPHATGNWTKQPPSSALRAHVFDDRSLYRPGETVHLKGWLRMVEGAGSPKLPSGIDALNYEVTSMGSETIAKGSAKLNDQGGFDFAFALPKTVHLGHATVRIMVRRGGEPDQEFWHGFQVEEYRRPEYEVTLEKKSPVAFLGKPVRLEAKAAYHTGGPLAEAKATWTVSARQAHFTPPGRDGFIFGEEPWLWARSGFAMGRGIFPPVVSKTETLVGRTDGNGIHALEIVPERARPAYVQELDVNVSVEDVNRKSFGQSTTLLVHPAKVYVGARTRRSFTGESEPIAVELIVTDLDGQAVAGRPVTVQLLELSTSWERGELKSKETEVDRCAVTSTNDIVRCALKPKKGGAYRIAARVLDDDEQPSDTSLRHWVSGEDAPTLTMGVERGEAELIADKKTYEPGETAKVMLRAPFAPADALVRVVHGEIVELKHVHLNEPTTTLEVKIGEDHVPNLTVLAELVGRVNAADGKASVPARASGRAELTVALDGRRLRVTPAPAQAVLEPGQTTNITVTVRDANDAPVKNADVALIVVDEAIWQMVAREQPDALTAMHPRVDAYDANASARDYVVFEEPKPRDDGAAGSAANKSMARGGRVELQAVKAAPPMADAQMQVLEAATGGAGGAVLYMRKLFEPLALFAGSLRSDANGSVTASLTMPDTLTRYRVLAVAAHGDHFFGQGDASITVRKRLMVRPAVSRFINLGDELSLPVVVQNDGDEALDVAVGVRATNLELVGAKERRVKVPAHDRVEVRFRGKSKKPGTVRLQFVAQAKELKDGSELSLPAFTPATDEAFATSGDLDKDGALVQPLALPKDASPHFGGLDVSLSSTQVSALTDAVLSVLDCPYDFPEQRASRILTVLATRDVLAAFSAEGLPDQQALDDLLARDIRELASLQQDNGSFGFYDRFGEASPFVSVHVSHALARAHKAKLAVPQALVGPLRRYVRNLPSESWERYGYEARATVLAYAAYTELLWDNPQPKLAEAALEAEKGKNLPVEAIAWTLPVFHAQKDAARVNELLRNLTNRVSETASTAEITSEVREAKHVTLASTKRGNAVTLEALLTTSAQPDLVPKLARGLLAQRTRGKWQGTQENVFSLLALRAYFDVYEREVPAFTARAFLDNALASEQRFQGRTTTQASTHVPMGWLSQQKSQKLTLEKRGAGRLYYRLGLSYAPTSFVLPPADHGFVVERSYDAVDHPDDVRRDLEGTWHIRAGARVKVNVMMVVPARRHHVALVDPLPAGLEAINPALAASERLPHDDGPIPLRRGFNIWPGPWFEHQNLRDERAEAHASVLEAGTYTYTYYARATTPGTFIAPPPKAEELYGPETFGRGETARVVVE